MPAFETLIRPARLLASPQLLRRAEVARGRAIALGYTTDAGTLPKPVADGESQRIALAKCAKWEAFIAGATLKARPRYVIPKGTRPRNCSSCGAQIWFVFGPNQKSIPVTKEGFSHFDDCPNASKHSKSARKVERREAQPKHLRHLFAVCAANKLDVSGETRTERLAQSNCVLIDHNLPTVSSWNQLDETGARCLAGAIDAKILTWGKAEEREAA